MPFVDPGYILAKTVRAALEEFRSRKGQCCPAAHAHAEPRPPRRGREPRGDRGALGSRDGSRSGRGQATARPGRPIGRCPATLAAAAGDARGLAGRAGAPRSASAPTPRPWPAPHRAMPSRPCPPPSRPTTSSTPATSSSSSKAARAASRPHGPTSSARNGAASAHRRREGPGRLLLRQEPRRRRCRHAPLRRRLQGGRLRGELRRGPPHDQGKDRFHPQLGSGEIPLLSQRREALTDCRDVKGAEYHMRRVAFKMKLKAGLRGRVQEEARRDLARAGQDSSRRPASRTIRSSSIPRPSSSSASRSSLPERRADKLSGKADHAQMVGYMKDLMDTNPDGSPVGERSSSKSFTGLTSYSPPWVGLRGNSIYISI